MKMRDLLQQMLRDYLQRFRNSDEKVSWSTTLKSKSPDLEGCEHDGPKVTTSHEGDTAMDELGDLI